MIHLLDDIGLEAAFQNIKTYVDRKTPTMGVFTIGRFSVFNLRECIEQEKNFNGATLGGIIREAINNLILIGYDGSDDEKIPVAISKYGDGYLFNIIVSQAECYEITITQQDILNEVIPWTSIRKYSLSEGGAEGGSGVYFSDMLTPYDIMNLAYGTPVTVDESKVADFISNAKNKVVVFYTNDEGGYKAYAINEVNIHDDGSMQFTYCGFDDGDCPSIACIYYNTDDHTFYRDIYFRAYDYQPLLESGTNIKTINGTSVLGDGNIYIQTPLYKKTLSGGDTHSLAWQNYYYFTAAISSDTIFSLPLPNPVGDPTGNGDSRNYLNEILIEFAYTSGSISFTQKANKIKWQNGTTPTFTAGNSYQISIVNNLACFAEFKTT